MGRLFLTLRVFLVALAFGLVGGRAEAQAPLKVTLEGTFTQHFGASCPDDGSVLPPTGSTFALTYIYDASQAPLSVNAAIAQYAFSSAPNQLSLTVNGVKLYETSAFRAVVGDSTQDRFIVDALLFDQPELVQFGLYFFDIGGTALASTALPASAPNLEAWAFQHVVALVTNARGPNCGLPDGAVGGYQIQGDVTKVTAIPLILDVAIDIKPGSGALPTVKIGSAGVIPVAILSTPSFDATQVVPESVSLAGAKVKLVGKAGRYSCANTDVNADGSLDMLCHVETAQFFLEAGESLAVLEAETLDGRPIRGQQQVRIVN